MKSGRRIARFKGLRSLGFLKHSAVLLSYYYYYLFLHNIHLFSSSFSRHHSSLPTDLERSPFPSTITSKFSFENSPGVHNEQFNTISSSTSSFPTNTALLKKCKINNSSQTCLPHLQQHQRNQASDPSKIRHLLLLQMISQMQRDLL